MVDVINLNKKRKAKNRLEKEKKASKIALNSEGQKKKSR